MFSRPTFALVMLRTYMLLVPFPALMAVVVFRRCAHRGSQRQGQDHR
jgi:hypothetical protein